jgi:two-component system invasion response regulator UvrY
MSKKTLIAIAENQTLVRKGVINIISSFNDFKVEIEADNGKSLCEKLSAARTLPDIVILDISMPALDGHETLHTLRKKWPQLKTLVLTMHRHDFAVTRMLRAGANGYLLKDATPEELEHALISLLKTGMYFSASVTTSMYHNLLDTTHVPHLSEKEIQLLKLCHTDLTYREIALKLHSSERSIAGYRTNLFTKLHVKSRAELVVCALQMGVVSLYE